MRKKLQVRVWCQSGFATIELLFAFALATIFLSGAALVAFGGQTAGLDVSLGNGAIETALSQLRDGVASTTQNWSAIPVPHGSSLYTQANAISSMSPCLKKIESTTSWTAEHTRAQAVTFGTYMGSVEQARALSGGCDPFPPGDAWDSPKKYPNGATLAAVNANDVAVVSNHGKRIVVLGATPQGNGNDAVEDIYTYDLTDIQNPVQKGKLNTGKGMNALVVAGDYAFALQNNGSNQLQVIRIFDTTKNISDPLYYLPSLVTQVSLQNVAGANPAGQSIYFYNNRLYIGTWNNNVPATSPEFLIYNVANPTSPTFLGSLNVNHSVNSIIVSGAYAYLATTNNAGELMVINVTNPASPTVAGAYDLPGSTLDAEEVYVLGFVAYLGLDRATGNGKDFLTLSILNPSVPTLLGSLKLNMANNTKVAGIAVAGSYAFVGTTDTNAEFRVFDVSNPSAPTPVGSCGPYNYSAKVSAVRYAEGYVFVANQANDALRVVYDTPGTTCN